jgi:hypothetical protein
MYPRNAASPPRLALGAVVQISDGVVQTSGVSIKVRPEGGTASAGGGTTAYEEGIVLYTPTQAETNYTAFAVIAYKTACVPVSLSVVTTANATPGTVNVGADGLTALSLDATVQARLGIIAYGTAQSATSTTLQLASASTFADDELIGAVAVITGGSAGVGQARVITDYVSSTDTATVDTWTTTPTGTITYVVFAAPPASATSLPGVNVKQINGADVVGDGDGTPWDGA